MITIEQLLESVDLDFEPRWVTKDEDGEVWMWNTRPDKCANWCLKEDTPEHLYGRFITKHLNLSEFANKHWTKCIYEVPRKTTGKIERLERHIRVENGYEISCPPDESEIIEKINELVDAVNELKGAKNE